MFAPIRVTHGAQQLSLFNAYHDEYCYLPVHLYEGHSGKLITTLLRPGCRMRGEQAAAILQRVLDHLIMVWPKTRICLRGDSHFSTPEVHGLCDGYGIDFILGQAVNTKLKQLGAPLMDQVEALAKQTEAGATKTTRPSCTPTAPPVIASANQFRLFLHSVAYVLLHAIKHRGMRGTQWANSNFDTIQLRLLKFGARVREQATKVRFHLPTSYPLKDLIRTIVYNLDTA